MKTKTLALLAAILIAPITARQAEAAAFMKLGDIVGEVGHAPDHPQRQAEGWIIIESLILGVERRGQTKRAMPTIVIKGIDASSPKLLEALNDRTVIPSVVIEVERRNEDGTSTPYLAYELVNVVVTSWKVEEGESLTGGNPGTPVTLNFEKIEWTYQSMTVTHIPSGNTATINLD